MIYVIGIITLYTIVIPIISLITLRLFGYITSYKIDSQRERIIPLLIGLACYIICTLTISQITALSLIYRFMVVATLCQFICLIVTLYWKISLHLTAMGAVVALFIILNLLNRGEMTTIFAISVLAAGALATSRLYLGCHTGKQILVGFGCGFITTAFVFLFI